MIEDIKQKVALSFRVIEGSSNARKFAAIDPANRRVVGI